MYVFFCKTVIDLQFEGNDGMNYTAEITNNLKFNNKSDHCIGTGRMDLALHKEYLEELKVVQDGIGFSYIRGHGLFSKYMGIYRVNRFDDNKEEYCFTYLDQVMDSYLDLKIKPILELGFMPDDLASGTETTFFWKGKISPPKDYDKWANLIKATLKHLAERYGIEEIRTWPVEVWNEPNLTSFWKDADIKEYFKLYEVSSLAVKEVDDKILVGGPAICGVDDERWLREFLEFVKEKKVPFDFVSRHHYTSYSPDMKGHYAYIDLHEPDDAFRWLERSRDIVDSFDEFKGMPIFVTEFNTSYVPNAPIHDTVRNASYVAHMLSKMGDKHESYSYWTFGDVFEEFGVPFTPFHGGFGLLAYGSIKKPTYWTFEFYKKLKGRCIIKNDDMVAVVSDDGSIRGVAWNLDKYNEGNSKDISFKIKGTKNTEYFLINRFVNSDVGNPLKTWHEMGEPASLTKETTKLLKISAEAGFESKNLVSTNEELILDLHLKADEVRYFEIKAIERKPDNGYNYERVIAQIATSEKDE